jgi:hypothetical protein
MFVSNLAGNVSSTSSYECNTTPVWVLPMGVEVHEIIFDFLNMRTRYFVVGDISYPVC